MLTFFTKFGTYLRGRTAKMGAGSRGGNSKGWEQGEEAGSRGAGAESKWWEQGRELGGS